jgi:hypothetical protein
MVNSRTNWAAGTRVKLLLPDKAASPKGRWIWVTGTVRGIDEPGLPRGVRVDLDFPLNGASDCYAAHRELVALEPGAPGAGISSGDKTA